MNKIDALRRKKHMSYREIASKAGISGMYVYLLAKGKRNNPSLDVMQNIAMALDESVSKVFQL